MCAHTLALATAARIYACKYSRTRTRARTHTPARTHTRTHARTLSQARARPGARSLSFTHMQRKGRNKRQHRHIETERTHAHALENDRVGWREREDKRAGKGELPCDLMIEGETLHCGLLKCAVLCCSVLHCAAVRCSAVQYAAVWCSMLQCVAVWYSVVQCVTKYLQ